MGAYFTDTGILKGHWRRGGAWMLGTEPLAFEESRPKLLLLLYLLLVVVYSIITNISIMYLSISLVVVYLVVFLSLERRPRSCDTGCRAIRGFSDIASNVGANFLQRRSGNKTLPCTGH